MKLVSVVIPTHKGSGYVLHAVESVLKQDYPEIEVIVVDDNGLGTPEQQATQAVIETLNDARVHYVAHEVNKNGSAARNTGVKAARGAYIALLDDDDVYYPWKVSSEVAALEPLGDEWAMAYCSVDIRRGRQLYTHRARYSGDLFYRVMLRNNVPMGSGSLLIRREAYEKLGGFDERFRRHQDYEFTARVAADYKIVAVKRAGYQYNRDVGRNSVRTVDSAVEFRQQYIEHLMPVIERRLNGRKRQVAVLSNLADALFPFLNQRPSKELYRRFVKESTRWFSKARPDALLCVACLRIKKYIRNKFEARFLRRAAEGNKNDE